MHKILITSVGSRVGQALLEALAPHRSELFVLGTNSVALAPNLFACDKACLLPPTADPAFRPAFERLLLSEQPDLVLAARDEDLVSLGEFSLDPRFERICFPVAPPELSAVFNDKYHSWQFARAAGLPFADSAFSPEEVTALIEAQGFPLLAKPRWNGHASKDVFMVLNPDQAELLLQEKRFVFQPILHAATLAGRYEDFGRKGIPWLFSMRDVKLVSELVIGRQGQVISISSAEMRVDRQGNKTWYILTDSEVEEVALAYAQALAQRGFRGPLNLQGKSLPDGRFVPFELNGRFTGSANARAFLDYNQVRHMIGHYLADEAPLPPHQSGKFLAVVEKLQGYEALECAAVETLQRQGFWQA